MYDGIEVGFIICIACKYGGRSIHAEDIGIFMLLIQCKCMFEDLGDNCGHSYYSW